MYKPERPRTLSAEVTEKLCSNLCQHGPNTAPLLDETLSGYAGLSGPAMPGDILTSSLENSAPRPCCSHSHGLQKVLGVSPPLLVFVIAPLPSSCRAAMRWAGGCRMRLTPRPGSPPFVECGYLCDLRGIWQVLHRLLC